MEFKVDVTLEGSLARTGELVTPHGSISTPAFMPVGTVGAVKTLAPWELRELDAQIILGNTYHLHLRPGEELIKKMSGLQEWGKWQGPILTDSGGYQAYSLGETRAKSAKTTDEGVKFYSPYDGSKQFFTPENVLDIQSALGSDIMMVLDDCPPIEASHDRVASAVARTKGWAERSIEYFKKQQMGEGGAALFGIVQGGLFEDLRLQSLTDIQSLPFDGIAVGGVAIASEGKDKINKAVEYVAKNLDQSRPHYLMGVGYPDDIVRMVNMGMDMFDCVLPTRLARHGVFWTHDFQQLTLTRAEYREDDLPLDPSCSCRVCQTFSRSYLRHLYTIGESLAGRALSYHNLFVVLGLMKQIRLSIADGTFLERYSKQLNSY